MAPRVTGAALGLLAFSTTIIAGVWVDNPTTVTLSRALWAMATFCVIGVVIGWAARVVVREHVRRRERELFTPEELPQESSADTEKGIRSTETDAQPMGS